MSPSLASVKMVYSWCNFFEVNSSTILTGWVTSVYDQLTSSQRLPAWLELNDGIFDF